MHPQNGTTSSPSRIGLHRLRGLAALFVVTGHAFGITALSPAKALLEPAYMIIASGTSIFVLLAGMLFEMRAVPRLKAREITTSDILRKRWRELHRPYLFFGVPLAAILTYNVVKSQDANPFLHFSATMLSGGMSFSYWYIPFFLALMAITPLHLWFLRRHKGIQVMLIALGLCLSAFIHRPINDTFHATLHSLVYYLPAFWLGLLIGENFQALIKWLRGKEIFLAVLTLGIVYLQISLGQREAYLHHLGEDWGKIDLYLPQKIIFTCLMLSIFHRSCNMAMPFLDWCGKHSLAIFFLHSPILVPLLQIPAPSGFYVPEIALCTALLLFLSVRLGSREPEGATPESTFTRL